MPADPVHQYPAFLLVGFNCTIHYCWCDLTSTHGCWPRVSLNGMCAGSVPLLLNKCDVKDVGYDELVALHGRCSVKHQCMLVYMYILLFVCFHVLYISYMFRGPYGRLAVELNMSPS